MPQCILNLGARWRWVDSFTPRPFYLRETVSGTHWIGGWVCSRVDLDAVAERNIPSSSPVLATEYTDVLWLAYPPWECKDVYFQLGRIEEDLNLKGV
jgi:hypothetical protein